MTFRVQKAARSTCIYRKDSPLDIDRLEAQIADGHGGFNGFREWHHAAAASGVCCRGFWNRHRDEFAGGQIAQRLGLVEYFSVDVLDREPTPLPLALTSNSLPEPSAGHRVPTLTSPFTATATPRAAYCTSTAALPGRG